jgi:hypothetical protein
MVDAGGTGGQTEVDAQGVDGQRAMQLSPDADLFSPDAPPGRTESPPPVPGQAVVPAAGRASDQDGLDLLARFLVGIVVFGVDELMERIRLVEQGLDSQPRLVGQDQESEDEGAGDLLRYLAIGAFLRGQRRVANGVRRGLRISLGTTTWALGKLDRLTDNSLTRPLRRPIEARVRNWEQAADLMMREGKQGELQGRLLATETIGEITDDMIGWIAMNPELNEVIQELVGKQSIGMATTIRDNARQMTVVSDDVLEHIIRRILRRQPRSELPPSPLEGKPQTMYAPETAGEVVPDDSK